MLLGTSISGKGTMTQPPPGPPPQGPHHGYGYGPGYGHPGYGHRHPAYGMPPSPPPRKPGKGPVVAVSACGAAVLALVLVVVLTLTSGSERTSAGGRHETGTTLSAPPRPTTTTPHSSPTPTTTTATSRSTPPSRTDAPEQQSPRKILALADHPILQDPNAGLQNLVCNLPPWQSSPDAAEKFFTAARGCLDAAWGPFLEAYGLPFTSPTLHFPSGSQFQTQCGTIKVGIATAAYYCENNLYVPFAGLQTDQYGNRPGVYLALFAHEYGHHVQEVAGIMDAVWEKIYAAGVDSPKGQELSRRKELQAQCFSGMFLGAHVDRGGSITRQMYDTAWYDQETRGDDTSGTHDHGSNAHYAEWWRAGAHDNRIVDCNTFAASSARVS